MNEKTLMKGNLAIAQAALNCGCNCYFGYPITPQTEIGEYLSVEMQKRNLETSIANINRQQEDIQVAISKNEKLIEKYWCKGRNWHSFIS